MIDLAAYAQSSQRQTQPPYLVQPHNKGKHSHHTWYNRTTKANTSTVPGTTAWQRQTQPPYLVQPHDKGKKQPSYLVQPHDKGKHSHHTLYNRMTKANTAIIPSTTAWQRQTQPPYLAKSHDKGKHSHHTLHNSREPQMNKPCLHTVGSWTRSKHRKGSKEHYLLGKKTTCKFSG